MGGKQEPVRLQHLAQESVTSDFLAGCWPSPLAGVSALLPHLQAEG